MKINPSNIKMSNFLNAAHLRYVLIFVGLMCAHSSFAAAADPLDEGIAAFKQGNFARAREVFTEYMDTADETETQAKIYMFAMKDAVPVKPSEAVIKSILAQSGDNPLFEVLEGRLHLLGYHPKTDVKRGLKTITSCTTEEGYIGYAAFTLGLYYEGKIGGTRDVKKAGTWHMMARDAGFEAAMARLAEIAPELDKLEGAGTVDDEDDTGWDNAPPLRWDPLRGKFDVTDTDSVLEGGSVYYEFDEEGDSTRYSDSRTALSGAGAIPVRKTGGAAAGGAGASAAAAGAGAVATGESEAAAAPALAAAVAPSVDSGSSPTAEAALAAERSATAAKIAELETARRAAEAAATREREAAAAKIALLEAAAAEAAKARVVAPSGGSGASAATAAASASAGSGGASASGAGAIVPVPRVPDIAIGHEAFYRQFLGGRLEYRPTPGSDAGMIILPIRDLLAPLAGTANPLSGTFDLSRCGDTGKYLSVHTGYKKAKIPANADKLEVWLCPKFLVERELDTFKIGGGFFSSPKHPFAKIMGEWEAPVGYFWTWGNHDIKADNYDYLLNGICMDNGKNLYEKWYHYASNANTLLPALSWLPFYPPSRSRHMENFLVI